MHVLGTPPAFILSQDQTLMFKFVRSKSVWLILPFYCCFRFLFSEISLRTFLFCLEFSGLHYCLFVKVLFLLLEVFPEELSFLSLRQLIEFIISSSVCQELFSFFIFKLLSKPGCLSLAATVHYFIRTYCSCQAVFLFFEFLFRNPCCFRSPQQS